AGLIADLATDAELAATYVSEYLAPRRDTVWQVLQRGVDRGELDSDVDFAFLYDLLVGPLFMRAVVWGIPLAPDAADKTTDVISRSARPVSEGRDHSRCRRVGRRNEAGHPHPRPAPGQL